MENIEVLNRVINLMGLASTDETRYQLCGVNITTDGELPARLQLTVTDGHKASIEYIESPTLCALIGDEQVLISRESLPILKLAAKASRYGCEIDLHKSSKTLTVSCAGQVYSIKYQNKDDAKYPNVKSFIPATKETFVKVAFNASYLFEIAKALDANKKSMGVQLIFDGNSPLNPITIKVGDRTAVLMPMRA